MKVMIQCIGNMFIYNAFEETTLDNVLVKDKLEGKIAAQ